MTDAAWQPFATPLHYLGLPASLTPPIWRERRAGAELAALIAARPAPPAPPEPGAPVLVVPGFAAGDDNVSLLRDWLRDGGWDARPTGLSDGRRCSSRDLAVVEDTLVRVHAETRQPVTLVGHSRGGMFAKALAVRHPDRVRALVTLGAPLTDPFGVHLAVRLLTIWMAMMTRLGRRDWVRNCPFGECCRQVHDDVLAAVPAHLPFTSIASRSDGIVSWRAAQDPGAHCVTVDSSHGGMVAHPGVWAAVAEALTTCGPARRPR
ncbi:alpha/beta fold hydrolase [Micromonospora mirobrigensis]|uniref:Alpha/beta hydrolase family protein n=1 Tax=Micromonospora mirobrigensis TaxID=262898 RepID=A0A1C4WAD7_9ACTN|nr:alpha/beta fold hydrolase [Micromonospora mirobrigensis]SCE93197.1 Alpha/beta hydrolase family protein [Micromonospora mirobrigensis]